MMLLGYWVMEFSRLWVYSFMGLWEYSKRVSIGVDFSSRSPEGRNTPALGGAQRMNGISGSHEGRNIPHDPEGHMSVANCHEQDIRPRRVACPS